MNRPTSTIDPSDYALILRVARKLRRRLPPMVDMGDLINDGYLGFDAATRSFDSSKGMGFTRYAGWRIRGAMLDGLRSRAWAPRPIRKGDEPIPKILLREMDCVTSANAACGSLDDSDEIQWVRTILARLPRQARRVIHLYHCEGHELKEVGMILGVTESRVSQIRWRAIRELRKRIEQRAA
jgi:RNA polymerase sigma factor for flagellar operon FliA